MVITSLLIAFLGFFESAPVPVETDISVVTRPCVAGDSGLAWEAVVNWPGEFTCTLYDLEGNVVAGPAASGRFTVAAVSPWSPEKPSLYRLVVEDASGLYSSLVPFRQTEVKGKTFRLNGRDLELTTLSRGSDYGDESVESMREEIRFLKSAGCNAVPAGLHGGSSGWRRLCLEEGVYIAAPNEPLTRRICRDESDFRQLAYENRPWSVKATNYFQRVVVANRNAFTDAAGVTLAWTALKDGLGFAEGEFDLRGLKPRAECVFEMPEEVVMARAGDASLSIRFAFRKDGELIAEDQIDVVESRSSETFLPRPETRWFFFGLRYPAIAYRDEADVFALKAGGVCVEFSKVTGQLLSFAREGWTGLDELLSRGFTLDVCRPPCPGEERLYSEWLAQGLRNPVAELIDLSPVSELPGAVTFTTRVEWRGWRAERREATRGGLVDAGEIAGEPVRFEVVTRWTLSGDGTLACLAKVRRNGPSLRLPHIGWRFALKAGGTDVEWFGRGPWECAPSDTGAFLGRWSFAGGEGRESGDPYSTGFRSEVRGFRAGGLAVRTLGAPFAFTATSDEDGSSTRVVIAAALSPDASRTDFDLAFTLEPDRGALTARVYDGDADLPRFTERPAGDEKEPK